MSRGKGKEIDKLLDALSPEDKAVLAEGERALKRLSEAGEQELAAFQRIGDAIELALDAELGVWEAYDLSDIAAIVKMRREGEPYVVWHRRYIRAGWSPRELWRAYSRAKRWKERRQ